MNKQEIRLEMLQLRGSLTKDQIHKKSKIIFDKIKSTDQFLKSSRVFCYLSMDNEVQTDDFIKFCIQNNKAVGVPYVEGSNMVCVEFNGFDYLDKNKFGVREPRNKVIFDTPDFVIVPGVAYDKNNNRIGFGKGYYDRFLQNLPNAFKVGVCFSEQLLDNVPHDEFDVPMDIVITD